MASNIFKTLFQREVDNFVQSFADDSSKLFKNQNNRLFHPGEYGMYKEACLRKLLSTVLSKNEAVSDGFIITSRDNHSTQCDILIHDSKTLPLVDGGVAKFFPIEDIYAIGEVKSNPKKDDMIEALQKLATNKKLADDRINKLKNTSALHLDTIQTFLVCNKFDFDITSLKLDEVYHDFDRKYWHNSILSLEDGLFSYQIILDQLTPKIKEYFLSLGVTVGAEIQFPEIVIKNGDLIERCNSLTKSYKPNEDEKYNHIFIFLSALKDAIDYAPRYLFDSISYLGLGVKKD